MLSKCLGTKYFVLYPAKSHVGLCVSKKDLIVLKSIAYLLRRELSCRSHLLGKTSVPQKGSISKQSAPLVTLIDSGFY